MTNTCEIDGKISEIDRLIKEGRQNIESLNSRRGELVRERAELLDAPLRHLKEVFGGISGATFSNNGENSPQVTIPISHWGKTFYKFGSGPVVKYPLRGIDIEGATVRLCFSSKSEYTL